MRAKLLALTLALLLGVWGGIATLEGRQPFSAQIQAALQILGLYPYGVYATGDTPVWNSTTQQFVPSSSSSAVIGATSFVASAAGKFYWSTRAVMGSPADAQINFTNNVETVGVGIDVSVDGTLSVRNRAQNATGNVTAGIFAGTSLFATHATLGGTLFQLITSATNDDPTWNFQQQRVATTDATVTTINTFTIPTSTSTLIVCRVVARRTGGAAGAAEDSAMYELAVGVKNTAGTVAEIAAEVLPYTFESQAGWNLSAVASGATELIQVTGAINNNVTWHSHCNSYPVNQ